jgi:hypothetical protein
MGERTSRVDQPEALENEIDRIRANLSEVVSELDYRRHELLDVKGQLQKHAGLVAAVGGGVLVLAGGVVGLSIWRARQAKTASARMKRMRTAWYNVSQEHVVRQESIGHKVLAGVLATLAAGLVKSAFQKWVLEPRKLKAAEHQPPRLVATAVH